MESRLVDNREFQRQYVFFLILYRILLVFETMRKGRPVETVVVRQHSRRSSCCGTLRPVGATDDVATVHRRTVRIVDEDLLQRGKQAASLCEHFGI